MRRLIPLLALIAVAFCCGFYAGGRKRVARPLFHDMIVEHPHEYSALVTPTDKRVRRLAAQLTTPEHAYLYVRDRIAYDPSLPAQTAGVILDEKRASCLGKAVLLCSLYRAMGIPASDVRVVTGEVVSSPDSIIDHAWIEMEHDGICIQQDPTSLLGFFDFDQFRGMAYTRAFIRREGFTFNDRHFAIVSRLNMLRGSGHP